MNLARQTPIGLQQTLRRWMTACIVTGAILLPCGIGLDLIRIDGATLAQWNAACTSGVGQLAQAFSAGATHDCGWAMTADHAIGWLIGGGIAALVAAAVLAAVTSRAQLATQWPLPGAPLPPPSAPLFCGHCGQLLALHADGRCPGPPTWPGPAATG
jgi:hypothetical protein